MSRSVSTSRLRHFHWLDACILVALCLGIYIVLAPAYGAQLGQREVKLSDNIIGDKSTYQLLFDLSTAGTHGSIEIDFCANSPFVTDPCMAPTGFTAATATLTNQAFQTGFSIDPSSTADKVILTRTPAAAPIGPVSYTFSGVTNPTSTGSYYVRLQTFATSDASGSASDYGGIAFAIINNISVSAEVPPYIIFCTGTSIPQQNCASAIGDFVNFGELSSQHTSTGISQMLAATNSASGYTITVNGTTLESGNNVVTALAANDVSRPGTSQFGLNLRASV